MMTRKAGGLLVILLLLILLGFLVRQVQQKWVPVHPTYEALTSEPDFAGWVMEVEPASSQIQVESQADKIVRPVTAKMTKNTLIFRREAGTLRQVDISNVHLKDQAELWLVGPVPGSFPAEVVVRQVIVDKVY